ncbi:branched-chain amino acid transport system II carrier protein [Vagococcus elongatus]|uniref:Branched-chain amino acid transport system carrier protein n=1 Tax=Vagococcus elongatus TaxID=180344 RepID=A0A430AY69_9ENTE|nr:branched-chain amino acid transport system II carrier protein [Vagococcus elongatus]RSU13012.1 branched-chain amino acid transport system II carrier protein [Vagococcus elongatus]
MKQKLSLASYLAVGSMLFGLFFGAGNLIFPVSMGQLAGKNTIPAMIGFIITGVGLPFLGVMAIGFSKSTGLYDLASKVSPKFAAFFTIALYLTIGPFFALPRTATVSFEIGLTPFISEKWWSLGLLIFTAAFFILAWLFALRPSKIMLWIGKILNPLFLIFLSILIISAFISPMGTINHGIPQENYATQAFMTGFLEGYNTMDILASLAFGIIVVQAIKSLGVNSPQKIAIDTLKSGIVTIILMSIIYGSLALIGAMSLGKLDIAENGGQALTQIANFYFGSFGTILLAIIVTLACLKTAIGLITACSETFHQLFPKISYLNFVHLFSLTGALIANIGLSSIIEFSIPVLMFLYPLAIVLIVLAFISPLFKNKQIIMQVTMLFTGIAAVFDGLRAFSWINNSEHILAKLLLSLTQTVDNLLPFSEISMGWIVPSLIGVVIGILWSLIPPKPSHN